MRRMGSLFLAGCMLALITVTAGGAQQGPGASPAMNKIIKMEIFVPAGRWVKVSVLEGEQARVRDGELNLEFAFLPVRQEAGLRIDVFRIDSGAAGKPSLQFVENLLADLGEAAFTKKTDRSFGVRVVELVDPLDLNAPLGPLAKGTCRQDKGARETLGVGLLAHKECCVKCGTEKTCGCAAEDWCGSCCSGGCCGAPVV